MLACKRWTSLLSSAKGEVSYLRLPCLRLIFVYLFCVYYFCSDSALTILTVETSCLPCLDTVGCRKSAPVNPKHSLSELEAASSHKSAKTHAGNFFVTRDLDLLTSKLMDNLCATFGDPSCIGF